MREVDAVIVSYNSRGSLRSCVEPLVHSGSNVTVVDNASDDDSPAAVDDLDVLVIRLESNLGFAVGCNRGWREGQSPYVLFVNPDASLDGASLKRLVDVLERDKQAGAVGPKILRPDGSLEHSQRRFPSTASAFSRAVFLHRAFPHASWSDELVRDAEEYARSSAPDWLSGACLLVRRTALDLVGGFDERFFMYSEDVDLCRRLRDAGLGIVYEPAAVARHQGGASAPRANLLPTLARSRVLYALKHHGRRGSVPQSLGVTLEALVRSFTARERPARAGHRKALFSIARVYLDN